MKYIFTIIFVCNFCLNFAFAQTPSTFTFQGIATNNNNVPFTNKLIAVRVSIVDSANAIITSLYTESYNVKTSSTGFFSLNIGSKSNTSNDFSKIDWNANQKYLKIEMDTNNAVNFKQIGKLTPITSTNFAYFANKTNNAYKLNNIDVSNTKPTLYQTLTYNSNTLKWIPKAATIFEADSGININSNNIITNTAPYNLKIAYIKDQKAKPSQNPSVANVWTKRDLNTIADPDKIITSFDSINSTFNLGAGTYEITVDAPFINTGKTAMILWNETTKANVAYQQQDLTFIDASTWTETIVSLSTIVNLTSDTQFFVKYKCELAITPHGLGVYTSLVPEFTKDTFTVVRVIKLK